MGADRGREEVVRLQYRQRVTQAVDYRNELWRVLCHDFFQRYIDTDCVLLDLGCGWGEFSSNVVAGKKFAMEMNPDAAVPLNDDVEVLLQDCSQPWPLADASLDVAFNSDFLEHLPQKSHVEATVSEVRRCLKPDGVFIALGPNIRLLPGAYSDFWHHHVPISDRSLVELLALNGFVISEQHAAYLPSTMSDGKQPNLLLVKLYLHIPLFWKFFGKQFSVVARA